MFDTGHQSGLAQHELGRRDARDLFKRTGSLWRWPRDTASDAADLRAADLQAFGQLAVAKTSGSHPVAKCVGAFRHAR